MLFFKFSIILKIKKKTKLSKVVKKLSKNFQKVVKKKCQKVVNIRVRVQLDSPILWQRRELCH
jgi:hypothetical protein